MMSNYIYKYEADHTQGIVTYKSDIDRLLQNFKLNLLPSIM